MTMIELAARAADPEMWQSFDRYCCLKAYNAAETEVVKGANINLSRSLDRARAVLRAIRVPSPQMLAAADLDAEDADVTRAFTAMIDAALKEKADG